MHAEDEKLATAFAHLRGVDVVLCVGDLVDGAGDLDRCVELLEAHRVVTVRGNHDRWVLGDEMRHLAEAHAAAELAPRTRAHLAALHATRRIDTVAGPLLLCHGLGTDDMEFVNGGDDLQRAPSDRRVHRDQRGCAVRYFARAASTIARADELRGTTS